jgi:SAM-dependent methyltransferase
MASAGSAAFKMAREWVDLENASLWKAMQVAAPSARGRLLDVGCGDKPYESLFAPHVTHYLGCEYEATYDGSDSARRGKADVVYSGGRLPFDDGAFDTVLCNQVAEHVPDPGKFLAELVRVLRPGGRLILTVPFSYRVHSAPHDFHRFTRYALQKYADEHGLRIERLDPRGLFWSVVGQKLSAHLALRVARMGAEIQKTGAFGYEETIVQRPRYWTLPFVGPAIFGICTAARLLDAVDRDDSDTLGYLMVAEKAERAPRQ